MKKFLTLAALALAAASCSVSDVDDYAAQAGSDTQITVGVSTAVDTKVDFAADGGGLALTWVDGESLGGWTLGVTSFAEFTMDEGSLSADAKTATFTGDFGTAVDQFRLVHPYESAATISENILELELDLSAQTVDMADDGLNNASATTYMISNAVNASGSLYLQHLGAAMALKLTFSNLPADVTTTISSVTFQDLGSPWGLPVTAKVDLTADNTDLYDTTGGSIVATVVNSPELAEGTQYVVNISCLPFTLGMEGTLNLDVVLLGSDGKTYTKRFSKPTNSELEFARAKYHSISYACDMDGVTGEGVSVGDVLEGGVVYYIADDASYAKVVSMEEPGAIAMSTGSIDMFSDANDGYANTQAIMATSTYSATYNPAIAWIAALGEGWYMPCGNELTELFEEYCKDIDMLTNAGATDFTLDTYYFSSSVKSAATSMRKIFASNYDVGSSDLSMSSTSRKTRAIKVVDLGTMAAKPVTIVTSVSELSLEADANSTASVEVLYPATFVAEIDNEDDFTLVTEGTTVTITAKADNTTGEALTPTITISAGEGATANTKDIIASQAVKAAASIGDLLGGGIVYYIAADASYAMVFSLEQEELKICDSADGTGGSGVDAAAVAADQNKGAVNTAAIIALDCYSETTFPAVYWAVSQGEDWYLPANGELLTLLTAVLGAKDGTDGLDTAMTEAIVANDGDVFLADGNWYGSSAFQTYEKARYYKYNVTNGVATSLKSGVYSPTSPRYIRAIKKVSLVD